MEVLNAFLKGMFAAALARMQHWAINLRRTLKRRNTGILLYAACLLFISCISYPQQNGRRQTCGVFRKALRQQRRFQSACFWCIRGLK